MRLRHRRAEVSGEVGAREVTTVDASPDAPLCGCGNHGCLESYGSGTALARLYVALLENYQRPDGSITIPEKLRPYFGADKIGQPTT